MKKTILTQILLPVLALFVAILMAGPSVAVEVNLAAVAAQWLPPGGTAGVDEISMWGFVTDTGSCPLSPVPWQPGPVLRPTDGSLTVNLRNCLTVPVSIMIPGQVQTGSPVPAAGRVRSFTSQTTPGTTAIYTWPSLNAGTFIYHSGTKPGRQVPMGLYGAIVVDQAPGEAYAGAAYSYDNEALLLYSEIDPELNNNPDPNEVARPRYEDPDEVEPPSGYSPRYFLINGQPFDPAAPVSVPGGWVGATTLLRFANIGLKSHMPMLLNGPYMKVIAEDGHPYPYAKEQYLVNLAPGKTMDALWQPAVIGTFPIFDRSHHLTTGASGDGGMLAQLQVSCPGDFDSDLDVDGKDLQIYATGYGPASVPALSVFATLFGTICQ